MDAGSIKSVGDRIFKIKRLNPDPVVIVSTPPKPMAYSQGKFDPAHPVITQSFLGMWAACPYAAKRRYIDGEIIPPGVAALQGTATDAGVTHGLETVIKTGEDAPLKDKQEVAADTFNRKKTDTTWFSDDDPNAAQKQMLELVALHHREIAPQIKPLKTQESILVSGETYDLAGTIDIVEVDNSIRDTKTSKQRYAANALSDSTQATLYSRLYTSKHGVKPPKFTYDVLVKNKMPVSQMISGEITSIHDGILENRIQATLQELKISQQTGIYRLAEEDSWRCAESGKWCGYLHNGCEKGKKL